MSKSMHHFALVLLCSAPIGAIGCSANEPNAPTSAQTASTAPAGAAAKKEETPKAKPDWYTSVPRRPVEAKPGDTVLAVIVPEGKDDAKIGAYKLESVDGETANLSGFFSSDKFSGVPGSLIFPLPDQTRFKPGDVVTAYKVGFSNTIGKVTKVEGGKIHITSHFFGPDPKPEEKEMDCAIPIQSSLAPLAWVAYEQSGKWQRGLALAIEQEKVYIFEPFGGTGKIVTAEKAKVRPVQVGVREYKVGEAVQAYEFGSGYRDATVQAVEEGGLVYSVLIDGATSPKRYFFGALAPKSA